MHQSEHKRVNVNITWEKPLTFAAPRGRQEQKYRDTCLCKISGRHNDRYKLFYNGNCVGQYVTVRTFQKNHLVKQLIFRDMHKKHILIVCLGDVSRDQEWQPTGLSNVENLFGIPPYERRFLLHQEQAVQSQS